MDFFLNDKNILIISQSTIVREDHTRKNVSNHEESLIFTARHAIFSRNATHHQEKNKFDVISKTLSFIEEKKLYPSGIKRNQSVTKLKKIILKCQNTSQNMVNIIEIFKKIFSLLFLIFF